MQGACLRGADATACQLKRASAATRMLCFPGMRNRKSQPDLPLHVFRNMAVIRENDGFLFYAAELDSWYKQEYQARLARKASFAAELEAEVAEVALEATGAHPYDDGHVCRKQQGAAHYARKFINRTKGRHGGRWQTCRETLAFEQARPAREKAEATLHAVVDWRVTRARMGKCTLRGAVTRTDDAPTSRQPYVPRQPLAHCARLAPPYGRLMLGSARCALAAMPADVRLVLKFSARLLPGARQFTAADSAAFYALARVCNDLIRPVLESGHSVVVMSEDDVEQAAAIVAMYLVQVAGDTDAVARVATSRRQLYGGRYGRSVLMDFVKAASRSGRK